MGDAKFTNLILETRNLGPEREGGLCKAPVFQFVSHGLSSPGS